MQVARFVCHCRHKVLHPLAASRNPVTVFKWNDNCSKYLLQTNVGVGLNYAGFSTSINRFGSRPSDFDDVKRYRDFNIGTSQEPSGNPFMDEPHAHVNDQEANKIVQYDKYMLELQALHKQFETGHEAERTRLPHPPTDYSATMYNIQLYLDFVRTPDGVLTFSEITKLDQRKQKWIMIMMDTEEYMDELIKVLKESNIDWGEDLTFVIDGANLHVPAYPQDPHELYRRYIKWAHQFQGYILDQMEDTYKGIVFQLSTKMLADTENKPLALKIKYEYMKFKQQTEIQTRKQTKAVKMDYGTNAKQMHYVKTKQRSSLVKQAVKGKIFGKPIKEPKYWEVRRP